MRAPRAKKTAATRRPARPALYVTRSRPGGFYALWSTRPI